MAGMSFLRPRLVVPVLVTGLLLAAAAVEVGLQRWVGHRAAHLADCRLGEDADVTASVDGLPGSVPVTWQLMTGTLGHVAVSGELPQGSFRLDLTDVPLRDGPPPTASARVTVPWDQLGGGDVALVGAEDGSVTALVAAGGGTVEVTFDLDHDDRRVRLVPRSVAVGPMSVPVDRLPPEGRAAGLLEPRVLEPELPPETSITDVTATGRGITLALAADPSALAGGGC